MCILSVCAWQKVVGYYDLSVLSVSDMFPKKTICMGGGWVGGVSSIHVYFGFLEFFQLCKAPLPDSVVD